jgi:nucleotide-binding universal stress UspA family protein
MKNILVLTDFSENASHSAEWGIILSRKLQANIILYNTFLTAVVVPNYSGGPLATDELIELQDESKRKLKKLANQLHAIIDKADPADYKPVVQCLLGEGSLGNNIREIIDAKDIELIVMGAPTESTMERILLGSSVSDVIEKTNCPALVVPQNADLKKLHRIVFATDFSEADIKAVRYLVMLGKLFNYELEIIHVDVPGTKGVHTREEEIGFIEQIAQLKYPRITYRDIRGKDVVDRLNRICTERETDVLALMHHQHSFFSRLFQKSTTKMALAKQKIPLLIFSSGMGE